MRSREKSRAALVAALFSLIVPMAHSLRPAVAAGSDVATLERRIASRRSLVAEWEKRIAQVRKHAEAKGARIKALKKRIAEKRKQLESRKKGTSETKTAHGELLAQAKETSAALADLLGRERALASRIERLDDALRNGAVARRVRDDPRLALAFYLLARQSTASHRERERLDAMIAQNREKLKNLSLSLEQANGKHRASDAAAERLASQIKELEKELADAERARNVDLEHLARLSKLRRTFLGEIADLERQLRKAKAAAAASASPPPRPSKPAAPSAKPKAGSKPPPAKAAPVKPTRPRGLPQGVRKGPGVDLMVAEGTEIHAVKSGRVLFAGRFMGYGNLVILEHSDGALSLYGFLKEILVSPGQEIPKGKVIGRSGYIEDKDRDGLRFEVRFMVGERDVSVDPRSWLPPGADLQGRLLRGTD